MNKSSGPGIDAWSQRAMEITRAPNVIDMTSIVNAINAKRTMMLDQLAQKYQEAQSLEKRNLEGLRRALTYSMGAQHGDYGGKEARIRSAVQTAYYDPIKEHSELVDAEYKRLASQYEDLGKTPDMWRVASLAGYAEKNPEALLSQTGDVYRKALTDYSDFVSNTRSLLANLGYDESETENIISPITSVFKLSGGNI